MDSGRGWNPTSSGDNTTEYGVRTSIDTNGLGCLLLCLIGMIPETRECIIILRYADSNLTMTAYVIQDRRRGQKNRWTMAMNAFLWTSAKANPRYKVFQEKNPALTLERYVYGIVFQISYHHRLLPSYDIDTATWDVSSTGLFRTRTGWICERSRWTGP